MESSKSPARSPSQPLFAHIDARLALEREQGDVGFFYALCHKLEYLTKVVTAGIVSCVTDRADRHRYTLEYSLVRADSLGSWVKCLNEALVGPPSQFLITEARPLAKQLTERVGQNDWRYRAVSGLREAAIQIGMNVNIGKTISLRQFFEIGVQIRNRGPGHGATTVTQCSGSCPHLAEALEAVVNHTLLLQLPWAYLHRNLNGKYNVSRIANDTRPFDYLKRIRNVTLTNGVYFHISGRQNSTGHLHVPLIYCDTEISDICLPNGNCKDSARSA